MESIRVRIFHTGSVCVSPHLPFGGDDCNIVKASGLTTRKKDRLWLPVSSYLIEHPKGSARRSSLKRTGTSQLNHCLL